MSSQTRFEIQAAVKGLGGIEKLKNSIKQLTNTTIPTSREITRMRFETRKLGQQSDRTENELRTQVSVFKDLRANVSLTSARYRDLTFDIQRAEGALARYTATSKTSALSAYFNPSPTGGGKRKRTLGGTARTLGAVAGGAVFGGPEGAVGGAIGGIMGGPPGALVGAAIGAQVGMVRKQISGLAEYSAALNLQRKALQLVINNTKEYAKSQVFLEKKSKKLAIPQDVIVRQFTALTASVKGAGKSTEDAQKVFESIASGIRGTGGSLEDMKAAMTATAQVFSKGKVSAEELRQQLGERLPGAFTIFAESMGKTPAELDKALEGGKVTLDDFMKFADVLFKKYGENAEILANSPAAAGDRLQTEMAKLKDNLGAILQPMGAYFQDLASEGAKALNSIAEDAKEAGIIGEIAVDKRLRQVVSSAKYEIKELEGSLNDANEAYQIASNGFAEAIMSGNDELIRQFRTNLEEANLNRVGIIRLIASLQAEIIKANEELRKRATPDDYEDFLGNVYDGATGALKRHADSLKELGGIHREIFDAMKEGAKSYADSIKSLNDEIAASTKRIFTKMEDALVDFIMTGELKFKEFARSIIREMTKVFVRTQIMKPFGDWFSELKLFGNAKGNVYAQNGIVPFAKGGIVDGIVNKPTIFPFANGGVGLMGEAGYPEAIIPLKRGRDGKLGVAGGGGTSVVVNVDASGSEVEGSEGDAAALGRAISSAVTEEIAKQKRPGGLLSAA